MAAITCTSQISILIYRDPIISLNILKQDEGQNGTYAAIFAYNKFLPYQRILT
jgi:hypothetical protein